MSMKKDKIIWQEVSTITQSIDISEVKITEDAAGV